MLENILILLAFYGGVKPMDFAEEYVERCSFLVPQLTIEQPLYRYRSCTKYIIDEIKNDHNKSPHKFNKTP